MTKAVYFFLIPNQVSRDNYAHNSLAIAEGLQELGYEIYANINYWRSELSDESFLFKHDDNVRPSDCSINVLTYDWMHFVNVIPYEMLENTKSVRVYLEDAGWLRTPGLKDEFRAFDLVLKSHFNDRAYFPSNYRPWAFGLTKRILRETKEFLSFSERKRCLAVNFGATHGYRHQLREVCEQDIYPKLTRSLGLEIDRRMNSRNSPPKNEYHYLMWEQTHGRHYEDYYERLRCSMMCSCLGGQLIPSRPNDWSIFHGNGRRVQSKSRIFRAISHLRNEALRWNQWESWRFWESMAAGSASVMLDFEKYGALLPVQPRNWEHYIGLDLDHLDEGIDRLESDPSLIQNIGINGRNWAIENYNPLSLATRFLQACGIPDPCL